MENELRELLIELRKKLSLAEQTIEGVRVVFEQRNRELSERDSQNGLDGLLDKLNLLTRQDEVNLLEKRMIAEWEKRGCVPNGGHADSGFYHGRPGTGPDTTDGDTPLSLLEDPGLRPRAYKLFSFGLPGRGGKDIKRPIDCQCPAIIAGRPWGTG